MIENKYVIAWIGSKTRALRTEKGWKLGELAEKSNVSIAMLSKIENSRVFPTFPTLLSILKALEIDLNIFFEDIGKSEQFPGYLHIQREEYFEVEKEESVGFRYENILTESLKDISLEICLLTLSKNAKRKMVSTEGFEYLYLIKGDINYKINEHTIHLKEGDSLYFDGRLPHVPVNNINSESILLVVYFLAKQ